MRQLKWDKKYFKVGVILATRKGVGVIIGFDEPLNNIYVYTLVPMVLDAKFFSDAYFKGLEYFVDVQMKASLGQALNPKMIEKMQVSSSKFYLDKQYDSKEIIFWRDKSKLLNNDTLSYKNEYDFGFKIEKGGIYKMTYYSGKTDEFVCLTPGKFLKLSAVEDYKAGKYDEYLTNMKKHNWRASSMNNLYSLSYLKKRTSRIESVGKTDISWFETKWSNLCTN